MLSHISFTVTDLHFFMSNALFQLSLNISYLFHELSFKCCLGLTVTQFIVSIFVAMSRSWSTYVYICDLFFIFRLIFFIINYFDYEENESEHEK